MKKIALFLLPILMLFAAPVKAQVKDTNVIQLMNKRMFPPKEVMYNAMILLPRLYKEGKLDTFEAVLEFWQKHNNVSEPLFSVTLLNAIRKQTFQELIDWDAFWNGRNLKIRPDTNVYYNYVLNYMVDYKHAVMGRYSIFPYADWAASNEQLYRQHEEYYAFLKYMAADIRSKLPRVNALQDYLLRFYSMPEVVSIDSINIPSLEGTVLQERYVSSKKYHESVQGLSAGVHVGTWLPQGNLAVLGPKPYLGCHVGGRLPGVYIDAQMNLTFGTPANTVTLVKDDSVHTSNTFTGLFSGVVVGCKLVGNTRNELALTGGFGYDFINLLYIAPEDIDTQDPISKSPDCWSLNVGLNYKYFYSNRYKSGKRRFKYIGVEVVYNLTQYNNIGGTDISGNTITAGIVLGGFSHKYIKYPYMY